LKQVLATVLNNTQILPKIHLIQVEAADVAAEAQPGQFAMVRCGDRYKFLLRRPLSIHRVTEELSQIWLLFAITGRGTSWLAQLKDGDRLDLIGPLGKGFIVRPETQNLLLIAGGIGIAPLVFLAEQALKQEKAVTLLLGAPTMKQLYPQRLLPQRLKCLIVTEDGSAGRKGMITDLLPEFIDWAHQICACGPIAMYQTMAKQLRQRKLPIQISLEVRMGCGIGACFGCSIKTKHGMKKVCQDGPVFELNEILWEEIKL